VKKKSPKKITKYEIWTKLSKKKKIPKKITKYEIWTKLSKKKIPKKLQRMKFGQNCPKKIAKFG
jgi:hypothetical protein